LIYLMTCSTENFSIRTSVSLFNWLLSFYDFERPSKLGKLGLTEVPSNSLEYLLV
jgi:hypothetical protein